jgi:DNA-binding MarR family transcriptional regulator
MKPETGSETVDAILLAAHRIRTGADGRLRCQGISLSGYKVLKALAPGERSMRELSDLLQVSPRTVTDLVDGLEARGLVARGAHPTDRRVTNLAVTGAGRRCLNPARTAAEAWGAAAIAELSAAEQETLRDLLQRVAASPVSDLGARRVG